MAADTARAILTGGNIGGLIGNTGDRGLRARSLLGLGAGLLQAAGPQRVAPSLGQAMSLGLNQMQQARSGYLQEQIGRMQMDKMKSDMEMIPLQKELLEAQLGKVGAETFKLIAESEKQNAINSLLGGHTFMESVTSDTGDVDYIKGLDVVNKLIGLDAVAQANSYRQQLETRWNFMGKDEEQELKNKVIDFETAQNLQLPSNTTQWDFLQMKGMGKQGKQEDIITQDDVLAAQGEDISTSVTDTSTFVPKSKAELAGEAVTEKAIATIGTPTKVLPQEFRENMRGGFNSLRFLKEMTPLVMQKGIGPIKGLQTMGKVKTGVKDTDAMRKFDVARKNYKLAAQALIKGIPSNFDVQTVIDTFPDYFDTPELAKEKINLLNDIVRAMIKDNIAYFKGTAHVIPDEMIAEAESWGIDVQAIKANEDALTMTEGIIPQEMVYKETLKLTPRIQTIGANKNIQTLTGIN